jgi:hypothetical protein
MADIRRRRVGQPTSASCSFDPDLQRSLRHGFPPLFAMGFCPRYRPCFFGIPPRRTLKHDTVFRSSLFSDSQIPWHRLRHELSRHGGHQKARSHLWWPGQNEVYPVRADSVPFSGNAPQPIRSITPSRFPSPSTLTATLNLCGNRATRLTIIQSHAVTACGRPRRSSCEQSQREHS